MISENYYYSPSAIRCFLDLAINTVSDNIACYCNDPGISFTRNRKLNCTDLMYYLIQLSDRSISSDLMYRYDSLEKMPSSSAVCQQRHKLDPPALKRVLHLIKETIYN